MKTTRTILGNDARKAVYKGVNAIADPVGRTLGPEGKNALLYRNLNRGARITNDGYTVAEVQEPKNQFVRLAARIFKESCQKTNQKAGDGTTTTAVIGGKLFNDIYATLTEGHSEFVSKKGKKQGTQSLRRAIIESAGKVKEKIKKAAKPVKSKADIEKIATVSVEDAELGKIVADIAWKVGTDGFIDVVEGYKGEIEVEESQGMRFPAKVAAKAFVNKPEKYEMVAQDCPVLITNYNLDNATESAKLFQMLNGFTSKLIVMCPSFSENVLVNMVGATKSGYFFYPVKVPSLRTEQLEDLAIFCGAKMIDKGKGHILNNVKWNDLGFLEKLIVKDTENKEDATALGGKGERAEGGDSEVKKRIDVLKGQLAEQRHDNFRKLMERRIASMASAGGIIRVGGITEAESLYKKLKIEDAVNACKAALRGGYVKGGGLCLKEIADKMSDSDPLKAAIAEPYERIQASVDGGVEITDDIIDPAEVPFYAVENSVSVVSTLITVDIITPEWDDPIHGEGEHAIANSIHELGLAYRRHHGLIKENEELAERDEIMSRTGGHTAEELVTLDNITGSTMPSE